MILRIAIAVALATVALGACSGRMNNFGEPADAGGADVGGTDTTPDAPETMTLHAIGEPCEGPASCVADALCIGTAEGGFACMQRCDSAYELCDDGSVCLPVTSQDASICYRGGAIEREVPCGNNLDCAPGLLCFGAGDEFFCRDACDDRAASCGAAQYCLRLSSGAGLCRDVVGAPCSTTSCAAGLECSLADPELAARFPGGYCTVGCASDADCPESSVCRQFPEASRSVCVGTCDHPSDCRFNAEYRCLDEDDCAPSADPDRCRAFFAGANLCLDSVP